MRTVALYITEISENKIRGFLGSFFAFAISGGLVLTFVAGTYLNFFIVPLVILVLPLIYFISLFFLHDTPTSLIARNKVDEAYESLKFYRTCGNDERAIEDVRVEFELLKKASKEKNEERLEIKDFCEIFK